MYSNHPVVDRWIQRHLDKDGKSPFSEVDVKVKVPADVDPKARASVNLESKKVTLYTQPISKLAMSMGVGDELMMNYVLSHELGHLLYQMTDKTVDEEYFAHSYGVHDTLQSFPMYQYVGNKLMNMNYR